MKKIQLLLFAFILVSMASAIALAQTAEEFSKCEKEAKVMCHGVTVGEGRILRCLAAGKEKLSVECRKVVNKYAK